MNRMDAGRLLLVTIVALCLAELATSPVFAATQFLATAEIQDVDVTRNMEQGWQSKWNEEEGLGTVGRLTISADGKCLLTGRVGLILPLKPQAHGSEMEVDAEADAEVLVFNRGHSITVAMTQGAEATLRGQRVRATEDTVFLLAEGNDSQFGARLAEGALRVIAAEARRAPDTTVPPDQQSVTDTALTGVQRAEAINEVRRITSFISKVEFDEVKAIIAKEPNQDSQDTWAMKLALADGYYAGSMYPEAEDIYAGFFKRYEAGPPPALKRFYLDSSYKYAQMLVLIGDKKGAARAYRLGLKGKPERHVERQLSSELAELLIKIGIETDKPEERKKHFAEANKICDKILWVKDLWFGKAVVMKAHMMMVDGKTDAALKLIADYKSQLKSIDEALKEQSVGGQDMTKLSPMAECRYVIGSMLQDEAEKLLEGGKVAKATELLAGKEDLPGAIQHFVNVSIRYPTTLWAPDARRRASEVKRLLIEECGIRDVKWGTGTWQTDWQAFLNDAAMIIRETPPSSNDESQVPEHLRGLGITVHVVDAKAGGDTVQGRFYETFRGTVHWRGKLSSVEPGKIGVKMPAGTQTAPEGWKFTDTVWVKLRKQPGRDLRPGMTIGFRAKLQRPTDQEPFTGVMIMGGGAKEGEDRLVIVNLLDGEVEQ